MSDQPQKTAEEWVAELLLPSVTKTFDAFAAQLASEVIRQAMQQAHREGLREGANDALVVCLKAVGPFVREAEFVDVAHAMSKAIRARSAERLGESNETE